MINRPLISKSVYILLILLFLPACSTFQKERSLKERPMTAEETQAMMIASQLGARNHSLNSFKGLGRITLQENQRKTSLRIAFAGIYPDRLRFSVMDPTGRVIETFACDGRRVYMMSHQGEHPFINKKQSGKTLEKILTIPLLPEDLIGLITGRPRFGEYDSAERTLLPGEKKKLDLKKKGAVMTTLMVSPKDALLSFTRYDKKSRILYRATFSGYSPQGEYSIPTVTLIRKNETASLKLEIVKFWPNANPEPEIFRLSEEGDAPLP